MLGSELVASGKCGWSDYVQHSNSAKHNALTLQVAAQRSGAKHDSGGPMDLM